MRIEINLATRVKEAPDRASTRLLITQRAMGKHPLYLLAILISAALVWTAVSIRSLDEQARIIVMEIDQEAADSVVLGSSLAEFQGVEEQRDSIALRIASIRGIQDRRYVWPRLLGEISHAMPAEAWLLEIATAERADTTDQGTRFMVQGRAGTADALTRLMKNLEDSEFIRGVTLVATEQERFEGSIVQRFSLEAGYGEPDYPALSKSTTAGS